MGNGDDEVEEEADSKRESGGGTVGVERVER